MRALVATLAIPAALLLAACASTARSGYLITASRLVNAGECAKALDHLSSSEALGYPEDPDVPQISFLKAQCYDQMGQTADAVGLYEFVVAKAPDSPWAYRAKERLAALRAAAPRCAR